MGYIYCRLVAIAALLLQCTTALCWNGHSLSSSSCRMAGRKQASSPCRNRIVVVFTTSSDDHGGDGIPSEERIPPPIVKLSKEENTMTAQQVMSALGTSPRRIVLSALSSTGIALAANFLGITSRLLEQVPEEIVESTGLDTYYPRGNYKRYQGNGFSFVIPKEWVADTGLELAKAQQRAASLDYSVQRKGASKVVLPDAAFGPPGRLNERGVSNGDINVSVIRSRVTDGFSLQRALGNPSEAAETLFRLSLAPEGSGRVATLLNAAEDERGAYRFEYKVERERGPPLRAISVVAVQNGNLLLTLTVVAPLEKWDREPEFAASLRKVASSFHLS